MGRHGEVAADEAQFRRQRRRPDEDPRPVVELGQELLLRRRRGLPAGRRVEPAHAVDPVDEAEKRRLQRLARRERQPDPDLRPGHDQTRRLQAAVPGQHHPAEPDHGHRQGIPAVPADAHQRQRAQQLPCAERDPRLHPGRQQLLLRPLRHVPRPEGPHLRLPVAPACRDQVQLGAAAGAGDRDDVGSAELVRGTPQLGPHLRVERAQPPDLRLPEPQRGLRLRQHARGRQAAQDPGGRREPRPVADELQRRLHQFRLQWQPRSGQRHHPPDVRPQQPRHLDQGQPHHQGRWRVPQHRREHPQPDERAGHVQLRPRGHRHPGPDQRQPDRELPPRGGGQRQPGRAHGVERLPEAERLDLPRRRHMERHQQAHPELRPALGLLLAFQRKVRPSRVLRPRRGQPVGRRPRWVAWRTRATAGARRATARATRRRTGTGASPRVSASPTRSTTRPSSAPDGASSTTGPSSPAGAPA